MQLEGCYEALSWATSSLHVVCGNEVFPFGEDAFIIIDTPPHNPSDNSPAEDFSTSWICRDVMLRSVSLDDERRFTLRCQTFHDVGDPCS